MDDMRNMTYDEAVQYIEDVPKFTKKNEASNTEELLRRLGHPEENFQIIHVAGTNGKGSVCAFLASMLQEAGLRTGLFTSPHLVRINERFQINRTQITDERFLACFLEVMRCIDQMCADGFAHPTYFEILFALGMTAFREEKIDWLVMETGLGGRLDATNTVRRPAACVITSISLDHTEYLGDTIAKIAGEKAGIIKPEVPVIFDASDREAAGVILERARELEAPAIPYYPQMAQITARTQEGITYVLNNRYYDYKEVTVPFLADYQVTNSALAMTALRAVEAFDQISDTQVIRAVGRTRWSGRMEMILPGVLLDGAHNTDGIEQFLRTVERISQSRPVSLLFAAVVEKDYQEMIRRICRRTRFTSIVVTQIEGKRKVDAAVFAEEFRRWTSAPVIAEADNREAFRIARGRRDPDGVLFCVGSLYLAGEIEAAVAEEKADD